MQFTLEKCERVLDAAEALLDRLAVRSSPLWSPTDVAEETAARERLRKAYIEGGFGRDGIPHDLPGEHLSWLYMPILQLWKIVETLHGLPGDGIFPVDWKPFPPEIMTTKLLIDGIRSSLGKLGYKASKSPVENDDDSLGAGGGKASGVGRKPRKAIIDWFERQPSGRKFTLEEIAQGIGKAKGYVKNHLPTLVRDFRLLENDPQAGLWWRSSRPVPAGFTGELTSSTVTVSS